MDLPTRWPVNTYLSLLFGAWDEIAAEELGPVPAARLTAEPRGFPTASADVLP